MHIVEFCRAPSKLWVGKVVHNNGTYYSYGHTLDQMVKNIKNSLYNKARVSQRSVMLASNQTPTENFETKYMSKIFRSKYWVDKNGNNPTRPVVKPMVKPVVAHKRKNTQTYDAYEYKVIDGKLIVYGVVKVAEYNLTKTEVETKSQAQQPIGIINVGDDSTQSVPDMEIAMESTAE